MVLFIILKQAYNKFQQQEINCEIMTSYTKPLSEQKLLQVLQNCKQIPKDDRLFLRKMVKEGDQSIALILSDYNSKKLQIRLRKFLQKCKQNKKNQLASINRLNTKIDVRAIASQQTQNNYRLALSLQKNSKKNIDYLRASNQLRRNSQENFLDKMRCSHDNMRSRNSLNMINNNFNMTTSFTANNFSLNHPNQISDFDQNWKNDKYSSNSTYLRQKEVNLFTPVDFLNSNVPKMLDHNLQNQNLVNLSSSLNPIVKKEQTQSISSIFSRLNPSNMLLKQQKSIEKDIYSLKSLLIKYFAEDIFQHIVKAYFPFTINEKSVYLPYRQFLMQIQNFLKMKGQIIQIIKQNDIKVPLLDPFTNEYQGITLKTFGQFLSKYCLHKNNPIRNTFIVLGSTQASGVDVQKFKKNNSWKGEDLIQAFQVVVKKWGQKNSINYWQAYRVKNQKQFLHFTALYSKF